MDFLFDNNIDTTNIKNVLLIDKDTHDYEIFYNSCNETTFPIVYSRSCSRNDLLQLLNNKFTSIDRLCFVFSFKPAYEFLNNELLFRNDESMPYSENVTFIINLIKQFNVSTVDYLACNTLNYENWQNYYNIILSNTTASVGGSNDFTGNLKYGGDWTMESTGQDIEVIYFNSQIRNYEELLGGRGNSSIFIMSNNTIYGTGGNGWGGLGVGNQDEVLSLTKMIDTDIVGKTPDLISCGENHAVILMTDRTIFGVGRNNGGQLGLNTKDLRTSPAQMINNTGKTPRSIVCGGHHTLVLMTDNTIFGTGYNGWGELGLGFNSTNLDNEIKVLNQMVGVSGKTPSSIYAGQGWSIVLMTDGTIYGTGLNDSGQLGRGNTTNTNTLTLMTNSTGKTPVSVACGETYTIVLMSDGTIFGTGVNNEGQLGTGNTTNRTTLTQMTNNTGKIPQSIHCGGQHTIVLMTDGTIYGTGRNNEGQLGTGNTTSTTTLTLMTNNTGKTPTAIHTGHVHTIVLMSDNTVFGCGRNYYGELGLGNKDFQKNTLTQMVNNTGLTFKTIIGRPATVVRVNPTLSNFSIPTKTFGDSPFTITSPTSNSSGSFSYSSSNTSVATISGNTITIVGVGTATITATQAETSSYNQGTITASFQVSKATPIISGFSIPTKTFGDSPFTITSPTSNSSGSFSYSSSNTSVATISGNTITIVGVGTATITATQAETSSYNQGTITASFQVNKATPSLSAFSVPTKTFSDSPFTITQPTSNSSGSFSYSSSNTSVATISGNTITIVGIGTSTITATQEETTDYSSGTITASFQVLASKATPTISDFSIPTKTYDDSPFTITQPTSNSSGSFSYSSSDTSVVTISGNTITIVGTGTATITATQAETTDYSSGTITTTFQVDKANPSISDFLIPTKTIGNSPFTITTPTSNSNGSFSYSSSNTSVATISGDTITIVGSGTTTITATQEATTNYTSGKIASSFQVSKLTPSISGFSIPKKTIGNSPFTITPPTSNSNGSFSYSSSNTSVATISGDTITIIGVGTTIITATQSETTDYSSGTMSTTFQIEGVTLDIYLPLFSLTITSDTATIYPETYTQLTGDATADVNISTTLMQNLFKFQSDSIDVNDVSINIIDVSLNDIKYKIVYSSANHILPLGIDFDTSSNVTVNPVTNKFGLNKNLTYDYLRFLAQSLFGTYLGVSLFNNEETIRTSLNLKLKTALDNLLTTANEVEMNNTNSTIMRNILLQIIHDDPARVADITTLEVGADPVTNKMWYKIPFLAGDKIYFTVTIQPSSNQSAATTGATVNNRVYLIRGTLV
jgi:alpha-tubulin suppressor-like RCC1 family protein